MSTVNKDSALQTYLQAVYIETFVLIDFPENSSICQLDKQTKKQLTPYQLDIKHITFKP